ncbi:MAG: heme o synthase [Bacteroidia bacterium]|nr:heme o synthase [Bacteroidia bacterium]
MQDKAAARASSAGAAWRSKAQALFELTKARLSLLVALSASFGYAMAAAPELDLLGSLLIGLAGWLITGASNALNQVIEREYDREMMRTARRPMAEGRLPVREAVAFAVVLAVCGVVLLHERFNLPAALLGIIGLLSYAFVYTPMKRISPASVFIGAIPGGLPPLIGWVAWTGSLDPGGWVLFAFQFFWQFPHFWAIAWRLDEDYRRAGFRMLPSASGRSKFSATLILMYTVCMIPLALFALRAGLTGPWGAAVLAVLGLGFSIPAFRLQQTLDDVHAKRLMFFSFLYLPASQVVFLLL